MKKSIKGLLGILVLSGAVTLSSCGSSEAYAVNGAMKMASYTANATMGDAVSNVESGNNVLIPGDHKIIYTVSYDLESYDIVDLQAKIYSKVTEYNGYISYSYASDEYANYSYKVPTTKLNEFLDFVDTFNEDGTKSISTEDITSTYEELEIEIESLENRKQVYEKLLADGKLSVSDTITVYEKIDEIDREIKYTKQYLERLKKEVAYSTVNVNYEQIEKKSFFEKIIDFLFR